MVTLDDRMRFPRMRGAVMLVVGLGLSCQTDGAAKLEPLYPPYFGPNWYNATPAPVDLGVTMSLAVEVRSDALDVSYSLENHTDRAFEVVARPAQEWDGGERDAQIDVYRGSLMLSRIFLPEHFAAGTDCQGYRDPERTSLEAGGKLEDRFRVPLPARVNVSMREPWLGPRSRRPPIPTRSRWTKRVTLTVGVFPDLFGKGGYDEQLTLSRTLILPQAIEVLDDDEEPTP